MKRSTQRSQTGIPGLDEVLLGGLIPGQLYLLDGIPGAGKTTFALQRGVTLGARANLLGAVDNRYGNCAGTRGDRSVSQLLDDGQDYFRVMVIGADVVHTRANKYHGTNCKCHEHAHANKTSSQDAAHKGYSTTIVPIIRG